MELFKLSDEELMALCSLQERVADSIFPDLLNMIDEPFTVEKDCAKIDENTGEITPVIIPHIELFGYYLTPIEEMENEMKNRGILEMYRDNTPFVDYEHSQFLVYDSFHDRLSHLFYLFDDGFLTPENVMEVTQSLYSTVNGEGLLS